MTGHDLSSLDELDADVSLLGDLLGDGVAELAGAETLALVRSLRDQAIEVRDGAADREGLAGRFRTLDLDQLRQVARAFTHWFHLVNAAEEQHRIRVLRRRQAQCEAIVDSIAAALDELVAAGAGPGELQALVDRLWIMPVLTAHPTEARRSTMLDHLASVSSALERLDGNRIGGRERDLVVHDCAGAVRALYSSEESRAWKPSPLDELSAALHVFERTLLDVTPRIYREVEEMLAARFPDASFRVPTFLRWGTWVGGDRDGNPNVTSNITRAALDRHRTLVLRRYLADAELLLRQLSVSARRVKTAAGLQLLEESLGRDRQRFPDVAARAARYTVHEPWREKLWYVRARLEATLARGDDAYPRVASYLDDLRVLERSLIDCGYEFLAGCTLRDCIRRAQVFGFHLASMDLRQHSALHERAVDELLAAAGHPGYAELEDEDKIALLTGMLERADLSPPVERESISAQTREILGTLDMVGRARREMGAEACQRYVVSFTNSVSDLLEVLYLARAAQLAPTELRPVPLLEQLEDLDHGAAIAERMLDNVPIRAAIGDDLEVMIGYSDSGKQIGYFASAVALRRAQVSLAEVAERRNVRLTVFHGRGGAIGRGGGPESRSIRAQPPEAVRGRLRATEQGETVTARYARPEIAERDLEQTVSAVLAASRAEHEQGDARERAARVALLDRAAEAAQATYARLLADRDALARYALEATPIQLVSQLNIGSRPASRKPGFSLEQLRAIPWVFSWNQSRHGIPGWFGLGAALERIVADEGIDRARQLYREWPFFRALINNAQLALARADIDVAGYYARLAGPGGEAIFAMIREEHERTVRRVLEVTAKQKLLGNRPHLVATVQRRNPYVDVLSHAQVELLGRLARAEDDDARAAIRSVLLITINGIAAGLQTAG